MIAAYSQQQAGGLQQVHMAGAEIIRLAPNCSLSVRGAWLFYASACAPCLAVALLCVSRGFWPVLPFAGLELGLLGWALLHSMRRRHQTQLLLLDEDSVTIESRLRGRRSRVVLSRHWARVRLRSERAGAPSQLSIESHGRSFEVGNFLTDEERHALAGRLMRLVGRVNESPPLGGVPATKSF